MTPHKNTRILTGLRFGRLEVLEYKGVRQKTKRKNAIWLCQCDCGNTKILGSDSLLHDNIKSCGCLGNENREKFYKGYGNLSGKYLAIIKRHAKEKNREFILDAQYLWNLFLKQNSKCALSGISISLERNLKKNSQTASLDRIDSSKGYIEGNVQWVHKVVNKMKMALDEPEFVLWCIMIVDNLKFKQGNYDAYCSTIHNSDKSFGK